MAATITNQRSRQVFAACRAFRALQESGAAVRFIIPIEQSTLCGPYDTGRQHGPEIAR